jgi:hypothetical protein
MRARKLVVVLLMAATLTMATGKVRAEPTNWSYSAGAFPDQVGFVDGQTDFTAIGEGMRLGGASGGPMVGSTQVRLVNLQTFNDHVRDGPLFQNVHVSISLNLWQSGFNGSGQLMFPAVISGAVDYSSHVSTVQLSFLGPTAQSVLLGGNRYSVSIGPYHALQWVPFTNPPPSDRFPQGMFVGSVDARVDVSPVAATPEPASFLLTCAGLACGGVVGASRRIRTGLTT